MSSRWDKAVIGSQKHAECPTTKQDINKILRHTNMFPKEYPNFRDIVQSTRGDGYLSLHNILRSYHLFFTKVEVETSIPIQRSGQ